MRTLIALAALAVLVACSPAPTTAPTNTATVAMTPAVPIAGIPAGAYRSDPEHSSLIFRVDHLGFVHWTGRFTHWTAQLQLDPADPDAASVVATVQTASLESDNPPAGFLDMLRGAHWLDAAHTPAMTFRSTHVERTGANTARISGDFTMHGVTKPVILEATFNGGYPGMSLDPHARVGFSAHGSLKRSDFNVSDGLPAPGTRFGVGDDVEIIIECELTGPTWTPSVAP